jgi:hypothetical protein
MGGFSGAGFSLWGFVLAKTKTHRLKPLLALTCFAYTAEL